MPSLANNLQLFLLIKYQIRLKRLNKISNEGAKALAEGI